ncbi:fumarylacetoacetate hydrolase family protein [Marinobacter nanhaiticus D15-8W]|uniref:Fumarylacetoacetate hydrolase n=1 Tax=Marinobacter nanhaiticus D15-8W TaxID=626887 RepID=N6X2I7_9GAMM|nr:fumarylacetoacetate hydrolase family protein [Marinobacter nanhaiticus]ENO15268.1 fumarylacetoacetate hydrolase [Marinobacter nanhaiticus D15-8W]BES69029.1 fumarylacetoacetate hydrolase family protein [Marinobacter nanhaiticus D15-8W]
MNTLSALDCLPADHLQAPLVGRVWRDTPRSGPAIVAIRQGEVFDISAHVMTMADLLDHPEALDVVMRSPGESLGPVEALLDNSLAEPQRAPYLLAPCDIQPVKACGVTFAVSLLERVIEEQAGGDPTRSDALRKEIQSILGSDLAQIAPGSSEAMTLKEELIERGLWSQYMEVGIGPDAEVFSKAAPLSAVGFGARVGLHPSSHWNNPEPEIVLAVDANGCPKGATLGNDVNLRDIEGRSALLLGKAKDNNASCSVGPFIRLFDAQFNLDSVRSARVSLRIEGEQDGFLLEDVSDMAEISRDPLDLVQQTCGPHHQYPDGFMLFLGTMFSPIVDRDAAGQGFTHRVGDRVSIATKDLGMLVNIVDRSDRLPPWHFGIRALFSHLASRSA